MQLLIMVALAIMITIVGTSVIFANTPTEVNKIGQAITTGAEFTLMAANPQPGQMADSNDLMSLNWMNTGIKGAIDIAAVNTTGNLENNLYVFTDLQQNKPMNSYTAITINPGATRAELVAENRSETNISITATTPGALRTDLANILETNRQTDFKTMATASPPIIRNSSYITAYTMTQEAFSGV